MKLDRFCVNAVFQYPAFVVVNAQPSLLLFVSDHLPVPHPETSISCYVLAAFQSFLKRCHVISFCFFDTPFVLNFFFLPSDSSTKKHFEQSAIILLPSHSSLKSPGVRLLHLSQANHSFFLLQILFAALV